VPVVALGVRVSLLVVLAVLVAVVTGRVFLRPKRLV
jgi:hypothetical protein